MKLLQDYEKTSNLAKKSWQIMKKKAHVGSGVPGIKKSVPGITNSGSGRVRVLPYFLNPGIRYPRVISRYQNHWKICQK